LLYTSHSEGEPAERAMAPPGGFWVLFDSKKYQGEFSIKIN